MRGYMASGQLVHLFQPPGTPPSNAGLCAGWLLGFAGAGARGADLADEGGGALEAADDRPVLLRPAPDDFAAVCPELALLVLVSPDRDRPLAFDGFTGSDFAAICGWTGSARDVDCSAAPCFCVALALPVAA